MDNIVDRNEKVNPEIESANKRTLFFLQANKSCPLDYKARHVYSFLVYRIGQAKGETKGAAVTIRQIEAGTGLDEESIRPALAALMTDDVGLAAYASQTTAPVTRKAYTDKKGVFHPENQFNRVEGRVIALQGQSADWFAQRKGAHNKNWFDRFAYWPINVPIKGTLSPRQNTLLGLLARNPHQRQVFYAALLGVNRRTINNAIQELRRLKLVSPNCLATVDGPIDQSMWTQKPKPKKKQQSWFLAKSEPFNWLTPDLTTNYFNSAAEFQERVNTIGQSMRDGGYSVADCESYWDSIIADLWHGFKSIYPVERFVAEFQKLFFHVEKVTNINRGSGTFQGANSLGLLETETTRVIKTMVAAQQQRVNLLHWSYQPLV